MGGLGEGGGGEDEGCEGVGGGHWVGRRSGEVVRGLGMGIYYGGSGLEMARWMRISRWLWE